MMTGYPAETTHGRYPADGQCRVHTVLAAGGRCTERLPCPYHPVQPRPAGGAATPADAAALGRLKRAIRGFTVDAYTGAGEHAPNGPAEAAWARLADALLALPDATGTRVAGLVSEYLAADIERLGELRAAAEAFFGEDFKEPGAA